jgi:cathepsin H
MEAHFMMKYGQFRSFSEQQLVDCAGAFDNDGCDGGLPSHAFEYIKYAGGLTTEAQYPYMAVDQNCKYTPAMKSVGVVGGSVNISLSEGDLQIALFQHGPISVAFDVMDDFEDYESGIYASSTCPNGAMDVNHAVVAVGWGTDEGVDYWIIKNSWSTNWGENGYFRMQRGVNMCGIVNCNSYPFDVVDLTTATPTA